MVVTTPSRVDVAAQPGHLRRGEVRVEHQPGAGGDIVGVLGRVGAQTPRRGGPARRSPAVSGRPVSRSQARTVSPWLASAPPSIGPARLRRAPRGPRVEHRVQQLVRVLLDPAAVEVARMHRHLGERRGPRRSGSTTTALVPEVPWSMARTVTSRCQPWPRLPARPRRRPRRGPARWWRRPSPRPRPGRPPGGLLTARCSPSTTWPSSTATTGSSTSIAGTEARSEPAWKADCCSRVATTPTTIST